MREVDPIPLEFEHLRHAGGEIELQPNREGEERVLEAFGVRMIEIGIETSQLVVSDEAGALRARVFLTCRHGFVPSGRKPQSSARLNILRRSDRQ